MTLPQSQTPSRVVGYTLAILTFGMSLTLYLSRYHFGALYGTFEMIKHIFVFELIACIGLSIVVIKFLSWKDVLITVPNVKNLAWIVPVSIPLLFGWVGFLQSTTQAPLNAQQLTTLSIVCVTTLLVGIMEELLFRGLLLNTLKQKRTVTQSILLSAVAFASFHILNLISGISIVAIPFQLLNAFISGLGLGCLAIRIGSILPLIIWHWLWDFLALGSGSIGFSISPFIMISNLLIQIGLIVIIWRTLKDKNIQPKPLIP